MLQDAHLTDIGAQRKQSTPTDAADAEIGQNALLRRESHPCIDAIGSPGTRVDDGVVGQCDRMECCRLDAVRPALGQMDPRWLRIAGHRDLRKRVLVSFRLKDTIRAIESECYGQNAEPKDSVDQDSVKQRSR